MSVREWKKFERKQDLTDGGDAIDLTRTVNLDARNRSSCCLGNKNSQSRQTQHEVLQ